jgi:hypothetical protein
MHGSGAAPTVSIKDDEQQRLEKGSTTEESSALQQPGSEVSIILIRIT